MNYPTPERGLTDRQLAKVTTLAQHHIETNPPSPQSWNQGMGWYSKANDWCKVTGKDLSIATERLAWALAALSPRNRWSQNKTDLTDLITTGKCGAFNPGPKRALAILEGVDPDEVLGGNKTRAFGHNIAHPDTSTAVTVDMWICEALNLPHRYIERAGVYQAVSEAFVAMSASLSVLPHQLQAAVWVEARGRAE